MQFKQIKTFFCGQINFFLKILSNLKLKCCISHLQKNNIQTIINFLNINFQYLRDFCTLKGPLIAAVNYFEKIVTRMLNFLWIGLYISFFFLFSILNLLRGSFQLYIKFTYIVIVYIDEIYTLFCRSLLD